MGCCRLLRLPCVPTPTPASDPQPPKQPLQDADGSSDPSKLLPAPSYPVSHPRASSHTDHSINSNALAVRNNEPASITVGSIANAYFGSALAGTGLLPAWGQNQLGPAPEASQAVAEQSNGLRISSCSSTGLLHRPAAVRPASDGGQLPHTSDAVPYASVYSTGFPWEADATAALLRSPQQQQEPAAQWLGMGSQHGAVAAAQLKSPAQAGALAGSKSHSDGGSSSSNKRGRIVQNGQHAGTKHRSSSRAAANGSGGVDVGQTRSPSNALGRGADAGYKEEPGTGDEPKQRARPAARSPPRYHKARWVYYRPLPVVLGCKCTWYRSTHGVGYADALCAPTASTLTKRLHICMEDCSSCWCSTTFSLVCKVHVKSE